MLWIGRGLLRWSAQGRAKGSGDESIFAGRDN
jgi:hypothetical protein